MRLPIAFTLGAGLIAGLAAGCHSGSARDQLARRASFDFGCSVGELRYTQLDDRTVEVVGCGKHGKYIETCEGLRTSKDARCAWVLNGKIEVDGRPQPDLDPDPGDVGAPIQ